MNIQTFKGSDIKKVSLAAQAALGEDAMIVRTRVIRSRNMPQVEVVAAAAGDVQRLRRRLEPRTLQSPASAARRGRPLVLALAGPTGAGKTTTLAKLAVHPAAFGSWNVGVLTIDTFRTGAVDQLESYTSVTGIPLEVVYAQEEVEGALERLGACDLILVDSPGRSPRHPERNAVWMDLLRAIGPDEVHLVIPASIRLEAAVAALDAYDRLGVTHLLLTKLDEVFEDAGVADAAVDLRLPARWITDGQEIPLDLHAAVPRILSSLAGYTGGTAALRIPA
ncbi:MAG: hypothetical protein WD737_10505 [Gemmatimonadota bacterium]